MPGEDSVPGTTWKASESAAADWDACCCGGMFARVDGRAPVFLPASQWPLVGRQGKKNSHLGRADQHGAVVTRRPAAAALTWPGALTGFLGGTSVPGSKLGRTLVDSES